MKCNSKRSSFQTGSEFPKETAPRKAGLYPRLSRRLSLSRQASCPCCSCRHPGGLFPCPNIPLVVAAPRPPSIADCHPPRPQPPAPGTPGVVPDPGEPLHAAPRQTLPKASRSFSGFGSSRPPPRPGKVGSVPLLHLRCPGGGAQRHSRARTRRSLTCPRAAEGTCAPGPSAGVRGRRGSAPGSRPPLPAWAWGAREHLPR